MNTRKIGRRTVLRAAGGVLLGLPWLESLAAAQPTGQLPKRFVVFFSPNGTVPWNWTPTGTETNFQLSPILSPLAAHQSDIVVISGVDQIQGGAGEQHIQGMGCMLTGMPVNGGGPWNGASWAGGMSVDQVIADQIGAGTKFRSLELGVQVGNGPPGGTPTSVWTRMSYRGSNDPLHPENSPYAIFDRVFSDVDAEEAELARRRALKKSVLDTVRDDYVSLMARIGAADRPRVEAHLSAVRELEESLGLGTNGRTCTPPTLQPGLSVLSNDNYGAVGRAQMDLLVIAMACDLTRVGGIQWSHSVGETRHRWLDIHEGHHEISHRGDSDTVAQDQLTRINRWYAEQFAYLLAKLKSVPEGDGTLLDHTIVLWCNELAKGNSHSGTDAPYVLAGRGGGSLRTGRFLRYSGHVPHNNLLVSLLNAFGVDRDRFGNPDWCTGPLAGLL